MSKFLNMNISRLTLAVFALPVILFVTHLVAYAGILDEKDKVVPTQSANMPIGEEVRQLREQVMEANRQIEKLKTLVEELQGKIIPPAGASTVNILQDSVSPTSTTASLVDQSKSPKISTIDTLIKPKLAGGQFSGAEGLLKTDRVKLGGYADFRYATRGLDDGFEIRNNIAEENPDNINTTNFKRNSFGTPQLVLGVAAAITPKLLFNSEIEFEFAGKETEIEQMYLEYRLHPKFNLRGGVIIPPLGRFNIFHDSNLRDVATRPLVSTFVIPSTYKDAGIGALGEFNLGKKSLLTYEAYIVNGLRSDEGGELSRATGMFESKGNNRFFDNNSQKSIVGRLVFSPILGIEAGISGYRGKHDNAGKYNLSLWAFDGKITHGNFQALGEYARASLQRPPEDVAEIAAKQFLISLPSGNYTNTFDFFNTNINEALFSKPSRSLDGFYIEARYRFHPKWLIDCMADDASIAPVFRYDQVNFDRQFPGFKFPLNMRRTSMGISLRPTEAASFNFIYHVDSKPDILLLLPDNRPFPPFFTNLGAKGFSFGMSYAF